MIIFFFFEHQTACELSAWIVGCEMYIRESYGRATAGLRLGYG